MTKTDYGKLCKKYPYKNRDGVIEPDIWWNDNDKKHSEILEWIIHHSTLMIPDVQVLNF